MKTNMLFHGLLLGWLLASCAADDVTVDERSQSTRMPWDDDVFLHLRLSPLSTGRTAVTRGNGDYADGDGAEYAVYDATLLLFSRNSATETEDESHFRCAVVLADATSSATPVSSEITSSHNYVMRLDSKHLLAAAADDRWEAFVLVNSKRWLQVSAADGSFFLKGVHYQPGSVDFQTLASQTLTDVGNLASGTGLLMTSSPVASMPGGSTLPTGCAVTTLAAVDKSRLYTSEAAAAANPPAVEAYLERAAAKVQLTTASTLTSTTDDGVAFYKAGIRWNIDNENSLYYLSRHMTAADALLGSNVTGAKVEYRFMDTQPLQAALSAYRTYWGEDPNYDDATGLVQHYEGTLYADLPLKADADAVLTMENTVSAASMTQDKSTSVVVSVPFNSDGHDFYILSMTGTGVIYDSQALLAAKLRNLVQLTGNAAFAAWLTTHTLSELSVTLTPADGTTKKSDGMTLIPNGQVSVSFAGTGLDPAVALQLAQDVEALTDIIIYKKGVAYYRVMVKHFGDDDTPLLKDLDTPSSYDDLYGDPAYPDVRSANYLGRFGVVRNTWYNIEIDGVKRLGSAVIPSITDEPDDDTEYLRLKVIILPWMMHEQPLDF